MIPQFFKRLLDFIIKNYQNNNRRKQNMIHLFHITYLSIKQLQMQVKNIKKQFNNKKKIIPKTNNDSQSRLSGQKMIQLKFQRNLFENQKKQTEKKHKVKEDHHKNQMIDSGYSASSISNSENNQKYFNKLNSKELKECRQKVSKQYYLIKRQKHHKILNRMNQVSSQFSLHNSFSTLKKLVQNQNPNQQNIDHRLKLFYLSKTTDPDGDIENIQYVMEKGEKIQIKQIMQSTQAFVKFLYNITQNVLSLQSLEIYHKDLSFSYEKMNIMKFGIRYKIINWDRVDVFFNLNERHIENTTRNKQIIPPLYLLLQRYFQLLHKKNYSLKQKKFKEKNQLERIEEYLMTLTDNIAEFQQDSRDLLKTKYEFLRKKTSKQHYRKLLSKFFSKLLAEFQSSDQNDKEKYSQYISKLTDELNKLGIFQISIESLKKCLQNLKKNSELSESYIIQANNEKNQLILDKMNEEKYKVYPNFPYECIGVLRSQWYQSNKLILVCYGTGFLISDRILATCGHSIYSQTLKRICTKVSFVPGVNGPIGNAKVYSSAESNFLFFNKCEENQSFSSKTLENDIALVFLSESISLQNYLKIQVNETIILDKKVIVCGYPSKKYKSQKQLQRVNAKRESLIGETMNFDDGSDFAIYYNIPTKVGHSGSPVLMELNGEYVVVGIHTHKCKGTTNSGLFFNQQRLSRMIQFYKIEFLSKIEQNQIKKIEIIKSKKDMLIESLRQAIDHQIISQSSISDIMSISYSASKISSFHQNCKEFSNFVFDSGYFSEIDRAQSVKNYEESEFQWESNKLKTFVFEKYWQQVSRDQLMAKLEQNIKLQKNLLNYLKAQESQCLSLNFIQHEIQEYFTFLMTSIEQLSKITEGMKRKNEKMIKYFSDCSSYSLLNKDRVKNVLKDKEKYIQHKQIQKLIQSQKAHLFVPHKSSLWPDYA